MTESVFDQMYPQAQSDDEVTNGISHVVQGIDNLLLQSPTEYVKWRRSLYDDGSAQFLVQIQISAKDFRQFSGKFDLQLTLSPEDLQKRVLAALAKDKAIPSYFVLDQDDSGIAGPFDANDGTWQIQLAFRGRDSWQKNK